MGTLDDIFKAAEDEAIANAREQTPAEKAAHEAKRQREHDLAVREGWINEDGTLVEEEELDEDIFEESEFGYDTPEE